MGLFQKDGDVGMFVSSGGFTLDAKTTARGSHVHVGLIDLDRFIAFMERVLSKDERRLFGSLARQRLCIDGGARECCQPLNRVGFMLRAQVAVSFNHRNCLPPA